MRLFARTVSGLSD